MKLDKNYMISDFKNVGSIILYSDASNNLYVKKEDVGSVEKAITNDAIISLAKEKNIDEIIEYFSKIRDENLKLVIVGDGPAKEELVELSKKFEIDNFYRRKQK